MKIKHINNKDHATVIIARPSTPISKSAPIEKFENNLKYCENVNLTNDVCEKEAEAGWCKPVVNTP